MGNYRDNGSVQSSVKPCVAESVRECLYVAVRMCVQFCVYAHTCVYVCVCTVSCTILKMHEVSSSHLCNDACLSVHPSLIMNVNFTCVSFEHLLFLLFAHACLHVCVCTRVCVCVCVAALLSC